MILFSDIRLNENTDPLYAPNNRRSHHDNTTARASYTGIFWNMKQRYELVVRTINVIKRFRKRWNMAKHIIVKWILEWNVFEININFIGNSAFSLVFLISGLLANVILLNRNITNQISFMIHCKKIIGMKTYFYNQILESQPICQSFFISVKYKQ